MTDNDNSQTLLDTSKFVSLFASLRNVEIVPWIEGRGVSVLKNYPRDNAFTPVLDNRGQHDSVALIKIGFSEKVRSPSSKRIPLVVSITKASRYIFEHHWYKYDDPNSPSKEAVAKSEASRQPVNLTEAERFEYDIKKNKLYDSKTKKYVTPFALVKQIYNLHLKTLTSVSFRSKMAMQKFFGDLIIPTNKGLEKINEVFFGRKIKKSENFLVGIWETYAPADLVDFATTADHPKILGSDFPVTYQSATTFIVFTTFLFLVKYWSGYDILGIISLINEAAKNSLILAVVTATLVLFFDRVVPRLILLAMNLLIRLKRRLDFLKVKID